MERGLIAKPETVKALLAGGTQHRVPVRGMGVTHYDCEYMGEHEDHDHMFEWGGGNCTYLSSPFGVPGDVVWFKEGLIRGTCGFVAWRNDPARGPLLDGEFRPWQSCKFWRRDYVASTHMPRWASRLVYTVKRVWVEQAEGVWCWAAELEKVI